MALTFANIFVGQLTTKQINVPGSCHLFDSHESLAQQWAAILVIILSPRSDQFFWWPIDAADSCQPAVCFINDSTIHHEPQIWPRLWVTVYHQPLSIITDYYQPTIQSCMNKTTIQHYSPLLSIGVHCESWLIVVNYCCLLFASLFTSL